MPAFGAQAGRRRRRSRLRPWPGRRLGQPSSRRSRRVRAEMTADPLPRRPRRPDATGAAVQSLIDNALKFRAAGRRRDPRRAPAARTPPGCSRWPTTASASSRSTCGRIFGLGESPAQRPSKYPGNGIGLSTCEKIVQRYGGRIWADSPGLDQGSTFSFTLPDPPANDNVTSLARYRARPPTRPAVSRC